MNGTSRVRTVTGMIFANAAYSLLQSELGVWAINWELNPPVSHQYHITSIA